jgi:hypothetical protein
MQIAVHGILLSITFVLRCKQLFSIKKSLSVKIGEGSNLQEHQVTFGKKNQKEGSMTYQSFESLPQLSSWLGILGSSLLLPLFFFQQYKKKTK